MAQAISGPLAEEVCSQPVVEACSGPLAEAFSGPLPEVWLDPLVVGRPPLLFVLVSAFESLL